MFKKIAITLAIIAVIGIILLGVINFILPGLGAAFTCALQNFMKGVSVTTCADMITVKFK